LAAGLGQKPDQSRLLEAYPDPSLRSLSEAGVVMSEAKDLWKPQADSTDPSLRSG